MPGSSMRWHGLRCGRFGSFLYAVCIAADYCCLMQVVCGSWAFSVAYVNSSCSSSIYMRRMTPNLSRSVT